MHLLSVLLAAAAALLQPAQAPTSFEVVRADGTRQTLATSYVLRISLLGESLAINGPPLDRRQVRAFCRSRCPAALPGRRPSQDTVYWRDGRHTVGVVAVYRGAVGQNGVRVGPLLDMDRIEFGYGRANARTAASLRPGLISISGGELNRQSEVSGQYVVFRQPWITLTDSLLTIQGRAPVPRNQVRFIRHSDNHGGHFADPRVAEDVVVWVDDARTLGRVRIRNGRVEQPGRRPRAFEEVRYIELAPGR
ncbi:MAG TPA: hypothetical protein VEC11_01305 [Allosphingosinicella sp.]|nr:hypothetical protein [Allosphingosinicella sp.]